MIHFALSCREGHEFDGWFASGAAFAVQQADGLINCAVCGSTQVDKALMAPSLGGQRVPANEAHADQPASDEHKSAPSLLAAESPLLDMARAFRAHLEAHGDNVGKGFAEEARRMHFREAPRRSIYGEATGDDARALLEEGIEIFPMPHLPDDLN